MDGFRRFTGRLQSGEATTKEEKSHARPRDAKAKQFSQRGRKGHKDIRYRKFKGLLLSQWLSVGLIFVAFVALL